MLRSVEETSHHKLSPKGTSLPLDITCLPDIKRALPSDCNHNIDTAVSRESRPDVEKTTANLAPQECAGDVDCKAKSIFHNEALKDTVTRNVEIENHNAYGLFSFEYR